MRTFAACRVRFWRFRDRIKSQSMRNPRAALTAGGRPLTWLGGK